MIRTWTVAALAALIVWPAVAGGQEPRRPPSPRGMLAFSGNRGRIGVLVKTDADPQNDKIGARIEAVTPGGPAEKVGLKAGDIVTRFQGTALGGAAADDDDESGPGMKLIELARALDPGDTVQVEYRRGADTRRATIVADEVEWQGITSFETPDFQFKTPMPDFDFGPGDHFEWMIGRPWGGIELVSLNPDLGEYFGAREGVLVVRAAEDSSLPLKGGDVILAIGGRKPTSPSHAMRILRSYDVGETVTIDVQRKQRRSTLTWKVPEQKRERYRITPTPRRPREEPSRYRIAPRIRTAPLKLRAARAYRAI
jgi:C-terminal processing protease CtpA/Prc